MSAEPLPFEPIHGPVKRLHRAQTKLQNLVHEVGKAQQSVDPILEFVRNEIDCTIDCRVLVMPSTQPTWEDELAEIVHAARKSLDHLAQLLVMGKDPAPLNDPKASTTCFETRPPTGSTSCSTGSGPPGSGA